MVPYMKKSGFVLVMLAVIAASLLVSCKSAVKGDRDQDNLDAICNRVWSYSQSHPDGFTLDIRNMSLPRVGICVAYAATDNTHDRDGLHDVVAHALAHDGYVGGWLNSEDGLYYFDSVRIFSEDELDEALLFAEENGQQAIFVLSSGTEIRVNQAAAA